MTDTIAPPPPGYTIDEPAIAPPPAGYKIDAAPAPKPAAPVKIAPPPAGYRIEPDVTPDPFVQAANPPNNDFDFANAGAGPQPATNSQSIGQDIRNLPAREGGTLKRAVAGAARLAYSLGPVQDIVRATGETPAQTHAAVDALAQEGSAQIADNPVSRPLISGPADLATNLVPMMVAGPAGIPVMAAQSAAEANQRVYESLREQGQTPADAASNAAMPSIQAGGVGALAAVAYGGLPLPAAPVNRLGQKIVGDLTNAAAGGIAGSTLQHVGTTAIENNATGQNQPLLPTANEAATAAATNLGLHGVMHTLPDALTQRGYKLDQPEVAPPPPGYKVDEPPQTQSPAPAPEPAQTPAQAAPVPETPAPAPAEPKKFTIEEVAGALHKLMNPAEEPTSAKPSENIPTDQPAETRAASRPKETEQGPASQAPEQRSAEPPVVEPEKPGVTGRLTPSGASITSPEFSEVSETPTGIRNKVVDQERTQRGLPAAMEPLKRTFGDVWDSAMKEVDRDPRAPEQLIDELRNNPRALTDREDALLLHRHVEMQNDYAGEAAALKQAQDAGDAAGIREHSLKLGAISDRLVDLYDVEKASGSETGRGLNARKMLAKEDYSLAAMETRKRVANEGKPLTPEQSAETQALHDKITELQKKVDEYEKQKDSGAAEQAASGEVSRKRIKVARETAAETAAGKPRDVNAERDAILNGVKRAADAGKKLPDLGNYVQRLAENFIRSGIKDRDPLINAVHGELKKIMPEVTRRQTMDAISGYGDFSPLNPDKIKATLRDLKGQMQQVGKLQDMQGGDAPAKTGVERRTPSDEERRLIQQVNDAKKKGGFNVTDPATQLKSALESTKTRLKNQIADLEYQISTGKKIVKGKTPGPSDADTVALQTRRDALKQQYDDIFGNEKLSDEQRAKLATEAVKRSIADYEQRIKTGDVKSKGKVQGPDTQALSAAKARRDALREELQHLQDSDTAIQEQKKTGSLTDQVAELERKIKEGDVAAKPGAAPTVDTKQVAELKARRDALNAQIDEMRNGPKKTPEQIALQAFKTRTAARIAELQEKLANEDFATSKPPVRDMKLDPQGQALKAQLERYKQQFDQGVNRDRLKQRSLPEKIQDTFTKWRRAFVLSNPLTAAKLFAAATERLAIYPVEEGVGGAISKAFPGAAARSPIEAGVNVKAEAKSITEAFTAGMADAYKTLRTGKSDLDILYGKDDGLPQSAVDYIGNLHGMLKAPVKRAAFTRAFQKGIESTMRNGEDATDQTIQQRVSLDAYKAANRSVFLQDNVVTDIWNAAIRRAEQKQKNTGRPNPAGKVLATGMKTLLPIVKVPTNIVAETMQYSMGSVVGGARLAHAYAKGIDSLPPEQADAIFRNLKKGSVGAAVLALGFFNPNIIGGYYQPGQKRDPKDVGFGKLRVAGMDIPTLLLHHPLLETLQVGATARRVMDSRMHKKDADTQGLAAGAGAAALGLVGQVPFVREAGDIQNVLDPRERGKVVGNLAKSIAVPAAVDLIAQQTDKNSLGNIVKRSPESITQNIESAVPGLRQNVPEAAAGDNKTKSAEDMAQIYQNASDEQRAKIAPDVREKILRAKKPDDEKTQLLKDAGLTLTPDEALQNEYHELNVKKTAADKARQDAREMTDEATGAQKDRDFERASALRVGAANLRGASKLTPIELRRHNQLESYSKTKKNLDEQVAKGQITRQQADQQLSVIRDRLSK